MSEADHPLPKLSGRIAWPDATLLEAHSPAHLLRLARDPKIGRYLLLRIDERTALVDTNCERALVSALKSGGHTVKVSKGAP